MDYAGYCRMLLDMSDEISYIADIESYELLFMTRAAMDFFKLNRPEEYLGKKCYQILQGKESPCDFCTDPGVCENRHHRWTHYVDAIDKWIMFDDYQTLINGRLCRVGTACDITEQKRDSMRLSDNAVTETILLQCIRTLSKTDDFETAVQSFLETLGRFYRADRAYILEVNRDKNAFSNTFEWCYKGVSREIGNIQDVPMEALDDLGAGFSRLDEIYIANIDLIPKDGSLYAAMCNQNIQMLMVTPLNIGGVITGFLGVDNPRVNLERKAILQATADFVVDEIKKRRLMRQLEYTSYTDVLTGTFNRNRYIDDLNRIRKDAPKTFGAMVVDVNGLKRINDLYGHKHGDQLIKRAASVLTEALDEKIYRVGGDEFIVLFPGTDEAELESKAARVKERFLEESDCDVSIGVSWDKGTPNIDKEIFRADERMYAQKKNYYKSLLSEEQLIKSGAAEKVRREIEEGMFVVHYQPQVDMSTGKITGIEALVRKKDSEGGLRMPKRFVHFYEVHGMMPYVDIFVLKKAFDCIKELDLQKRGIALSVNVSQDTLLLPEFLQQMETNCRKHGVDPGCLKLEVAHRAINPGNEELKKVLESVRGAGFKIVLDDFGEGESNLDVLSEIMFDEIKFSKSMSTGVEHKPKAKIMARNMIRLCGEIQEAVCVVEGIENRMQADFFMEHRCMTAQGFYFHRPMCYEDLKVILESGT